MFFNIQSVLNIIVWNGLIELKSWNDILNIHADRFGRNNKEEVNIISTIVDVSNEDENSYLGTFEYLTEKAL